MFKKPEPKSPPIAIDGRILTAIVVLKKFGLTDARVQALFSQAEVAMNDILPVAQSVAQFVVESDIRMQRMEATLDRIELNLKRIEQGSDFVGDAIDVSEVKLIDASMSSMLLP